MYWGYRIYEHQYVSSTVGDPCPNPDPDPDPDKTEKHKDDENKRIDYIQNDESALTDQIHDSP